MVLKFSQFIFDSRGFSSSLDDVCDKVYNFICDKIDRWLETEGDDYSESFTITGFKKNDDFPITKLKLKLEIQSVNSKTISGGQAIPYEGTDGFESELPLSSVKNGFVIPSLKINIDVNYKSYGKSILNLKLDLKSIVKHEMTHLYQWYKERISTGSNKSNLRNTSLSRELGFFNFYDNCQTFSDLLDVLYYLMTREEFDASISEVHENAPRIKKLKKIVKEFIDVDPKVVIDKINEEMIDCYPITNVEEIPKIFLEQYEDECTEHGVKPLKWALKLRNKTFNEFLFALLDIVKYRGNKWIKKYNKISWTSKN